MLDRSKCKEMWVWDTGENKRDNKAIITEILSGNGCVAVCNPYRLAFEMGLYYENEFWNNCEEIDK